MIQIQVTVSRGENFTPASLMYRYAKHTPGVTHYNSHFESNCYSYRSTNSDTYSGAYSCRTDYLCR